MKPLRLGHRSQEPDISPGGRYKIQSEFQRLHIRYLAEAARRGHGAASTQRHVVGGRESELRANQRDKRLEFWFFELIMSEKEQEQREYLKKHDRSKTVDG